MNRPITGTTISSTLATNRVSWRQADLNHIEIDIAGHFDENHAQLERDLNAIGLCAVKRSYNKKQNRTSTTYKRTGKDTYDR